MGSDHNEARCGSNRERALRSIGAAEKWKHFQSTHKWVKGNWRRKRVIWETAKSPASPESHSPCLTALSYAHIYRSLDHFFIRGRSSIERARSWVPMAQETQRDSTRHSDEKKAWNWPSKLYMATWKQSVILFVDFLLTTSNDADAPYDCILFSPYSSLVLHIVTLSVAHPLPRGHQGDSDPDPTCRRMLSWCRWPNIFAKRMLIVIAVCLWARATESASLEFQNFRKNFYQNFTRSG